MQHAHFHHAADFLAETNTARAVDAALHFLGADQRPDVLAGHHALGLVVAGFAAAVAHGQILQLALAALVADRAIERVIDEQEFHDAFLRGHGFFGARW